MGHYRERITDMKTTSLTIGTIVVRVDTHDLMPQHARCVKRMLHGGRDAVVVKVTKMACGEVWVVLESTHPLGLLLGSVSVPVSSITEIAFSPRRRTTTAPLAKEHTV